MHHAVEKYTLMHLFIYTRLAVALGPKHVAGQTFNKSIGILIYIYPNQLFIQLWAS
jgi:hypothetical protein